MLLDPRTVAILDDDAVVQACREALAVTLHSGDAQQPPSRAKRPPLIARDRTLPMGERTYVMAILNLTDDSFSGDGTGADIDAAVRRAVEAAAEGADIIDVGAESARSDVPVRDADEEAQLVARAIERIARETDATISADTYKPPVAEAAMQAGAHIINDIGGFKHGTGTAEAAARYGAALVLNYTLRAPKEPADRAAAVRRPHRRAPGVSARARLRWRSRPACRRAR